MTVAAVVLTALCITSASAMKGIYTHGFGKADACQCLNWQETYASGKAECGQGFEFTRSLGYPKGAYGTPQEYLSSMRKKETLFMDQLNMGNEFCKSFYTRFDDTKCARTAMDSSPTEWYGKSWCYVSKECGSAMPSASAQVSVKLCEQGQDSLLSDMDPEALVAYGQKMGFFVPGYFVKVAYPVDRSFFYGDGSNPKIAALKASGQPVLVDKIDEHMDKMLIFGGKVYSMPNSYEGFKCVEGCDSSP